MDSSVFDEICIHCGATDGYDGELWQPCSVSAEEREQYPRWGGKQKPQEPSKEKTIHPAILHVLKFFKYDHLPAHLQEMSRPFAELASMVAERAPDNQETTVCLRKLLEAKDAAVRAMLP